MSRDRQIAVLASIVGLAGLIIGIVAISQDSGADDEWVRNRALTVGLDGGSETPSLQTQLAVQEVADLTNRLEEMERREARATQASTDSEEQSQATQVAVQGVVNDVVDLAERVAELETTSVPDGPEEVAPTEEIPTEEVEYGEEVDQVAVHDDGAGVTEELTEELLTPPPTTTEPDNDSESLAIPNQPLELPPPPGSDHTPMPVLGYGKPAFIAHRELIVSNEETGIVQKGTVDAECEWWKYEPHYMLFNGYPDCEEEILVSDVPDWSTPPTETYADSYLIAYLTCTRVIWHADPSSMGPQYPTVLIWQNDTKNADYWLAPSQSNLGWDFDYGTAGSTARLWEKGTAKEILAWDWWNTHGTIETNELTIIIHDHDTNEVHYVDLRASLSFLLTAEGSWTKGVGPSRCTADLTMIRSYEK